MQKFPKGKEFQKLKQNKTRKKRNQPNNNNNKKLNNMKHWNMTQVPMLPICIVKPEC